MGDTHGRRFGHEVQRVRVVTTSARELLPSAIDERDRGAQPTVAAEPRLDFHRAETSGRPSERDHEPTARAKTRDAPFFPRSRQRWQHEQFTVVALEQHLGDAGGAAEIAVDLEWRVRIEQVVVRAAAAFVAERRVAHGPELIGEQLVCALAVE